MDIRRIFQNSSGVRIFEGMRVRQTGNLWTSEQIEEDNSHEAYQSEANGINVAQREGKIDAGRTISPGRLLKSADESSEESINIHPKARLTI